MNERTQKIKKISRKIKDLRKSAKWSQSELARKASVTPAAINQIESGNRLPSIIVARKIASAFNVPVGEITGDEDQNSQSIDEKAQAFFRDFGSIDDLNEVDKELVMQFVKRLRS